jgi:hypothetical protein
MNERILELAREAGHVGFTKWDYFDINKFAELIVKECARRSYLEDSGNPEVEEALEFWRKDMLKHFGVEQDITTHEIKLTTDPERIRQANYLLNGGR